MRKFWYVIGELTEVQRYINVPMRWCEQYPSRERHDVWIAADNGNEAKLTVHSRVMPARRGHRVNVLVLGDLVVGLANLTTGRQMNFVRVDTAAAGTQVRSPGRVEHLRRWHRGSRGLG